MRKSLFIAVALAALAGTAYAADLPLKAARFNPNCPYLGSGFHFGLDAEGGVQTSKSSGTFASQFAAGNLIAAGGAVGGTVGYTWGTCTNFWSVEATVDYQNISGSGNASGPGGMAVAVNTVSKWQANEVIKWGGFSSLLSYLPNFGIQFPALPALPVGLSNVGTSHAYVMVGIQEYGLSGAFGTVNGSTWGAAPLVGMGTLAPILDTTGKPNGAVLDLYAKVVFENKGVALNNVFASGGPPTIGASGHLDKSYFAGLKILY
jgi:hypothetical protein